MFLLLLLNSSLISSKFTVATADLRFKNSRTLVELKANGDCPDSFMMFKLPPSFNSLIMIYENMLAIINIKKYIHVSFLEGVVERGVSVVTDLVGVGSQGQKKVGDHFTVDTVIQWRIPLFIN